MSIGKLPPPPVKAQTGSFAWQSWYQQLYTFLSTSGSITWAQVNKATSNLSDLVTRAHASLQSVLGNGSYHLSLAERDRATTVLSKAGDPGTGDIAAGTWAIYKNTTSGNVKLWTNDGGVMKSVPIV